jgi:hypothetical protein
VEVVVSTTFLSPVPGEVFSSASDSWVDVDAVLESLGMILRASVLLVFRSVGSVGAASWISPLAPGAARMARKCLILKKYVLALSFTVLLVDRWMS